MGMFDNYNNIDPEAIPDNRRRCFPRKGNSIVAGGTSSLAFELPSYYSEGVQKITIIFSQEQRIIMEKDPASVVIDGCKMYVECSLGSTETREFGNTLLDTSVQLKLEYFDRTLYTEIEKVNVMQTLDNDGPGPDVSVLTGFGYTED